MGCSSCKRAQSYEVAKDLAIKAVKLFQSNFRIYKQRMNNEYTYGIEPESEKIGKWRQEVEVVQFQQYQSIEVLSDISGEGLDVVVKETISTEKPNRKSGKRNSGTVESDSGTV